MKRIKTLKVLGNIFSPLLIPLLLLIIGICRILYLWPWNGLEKFYTPTGQKKEKRSRRSGHTPHQTLPKIYRIFPKMKFRHLHKELEFSCAWNAVRIVLDLIDIHVSEEELYAMTGDKNMGTSHWEVKRVLNKLFKKHQSLYDAKIYSRIRFQDLESALEKQYPVIILFLTPFVQEGMSKDPYYPHFALLKGIDWNTRTIQLMSPSGAGVLHEEVEGQPGTVQFEISRFLELFYARPKYINKVEYLATKTIGKKSIERSIKNTSNWIYNIFIRIALLSAYCLRILKPGTIVMIEPKK